jgi:nucleotide-binding universal stress UspA family protein
MFRHILVPTDGSTLSRNAAKKAIGLAKALGARVTALHVTPPHEMSFYGDFVPPNYVPSKDYEERVKKTALRYLEAIEKAAKTAGVRCKGTYVAGAQPFEQILKAAQKNRCDVIAMSSHGRSGISRLLLGSETAKVLTHSKIPVLVIR